MGEKKEETVTKPEGDKKPVDGGNNTVVVMKLDMHCEGCGKKIKRILKKHKGVEDVKIDYKDDKLTVVGNVDPTAVRDKVAERMKRKVEIVSTVAPKKEAPPPSGGEKKVVEEKPAEKKPADEKPAGEKKVEMKKDEGEKKSPSPPAPPKESTVVLKTKLHCEGCEHKIKRIVNKIKVPYALASGGWLSLIILFTVAITTFYCAILIKRCMDMDPLLRTYPDIGYKAFGNTGRVVVSIFMNLELYLVATSFLILEGDNLNKLFSNVGFNFMDIEFGGKQMFIVVVALIILPTVWLDDMRILSYVSASGVFASGLILASIFWVGAFDGVGFKNQDSKMLQINGVTTSVSLYMFCYCAHPVFPTLYTSMKNKHQFSNVMVICFTICTFIYASVAILGYLMYGSNVESQITLNLPTDKLSSKVAICTTLVNPIAKFALMVTPIIDALRSRFMRNKKAGGLVLGTMLVASNVIFALLLPFFGELMSLVGALLSATASVILPCLCYLKISGKYRRLGLETLVLIGLILIGIVVVITGTYKAVKDIFGRF